MKGMRWIGPNVGLRLRPSSLTPLIGHMRYPLIPRPQACPPMLSGESPRQTNKRTMQLVCHTHPTTFKPPLGIQSEVTLLPSETTHRLPHLRCPQASFEQTDCSTIVIAAQQQQVQRLHQVQGKAGRDVALSGEVHRRPGRI